MEMLSNLNFRQRLHERGFDAVTPSVYKTPIETIGKPDRFKNAAKSGAFSKRYGFICRINNETASI